MFVDLQYTPSIVVNKDILRYHRMYLSSHHLYGSISYAIGVARPSSGDENGAKLYHEKNSKTILKIYTHPNNYVRYNQDGLIKEDEE